MSIAEYLEWYILYIPASVYGWGLAAFFAVLLLMVFWKGGAQGLRYATAFLLMEYVALLLYFTVFIRSATGERHLLLVPFWSYWAIAGGVKVLVQEHLMNVAVFVPIGLMLSFVLKGVRWWKVLIVGVAISVCVEVLQYVLMRGYGEVDDVIHNSLGCLTGIAVTKIFKMKVNQEK